MGDVISSGLEILSYIVVLLGVLMIIWTGFQFILAQGESKRLNELKSQLMWIVIGLAIVIGARIIVSVVINTLATTGAVSSGVIQNANNALNSSK